MTCTGIGGLFFRARDPAALQSWYLKFFGIGGEEHGQWQQQAGPTIFMPFAAATDYFPADKQWMINLRVTDLDSLVETLRHNGIAVQTDPTWDTPETGRFARVHDPEGNPIELWQPPAM